MRVLKLKICYAVVICTMWQFAAFAQATRPTTWAQAVPAKHIKNFYKVEEGLYRSAQPERDAMKEIEAKGIKTVLNLRAVHDDEDEAKDTTLKLLEIPINTWNITDEEIVQVLKIMQDKNNRPLLVHCQHGADRTGTVVAMYRIVIQGWQKEEAIKELMEGGFGYHAVWTNIPKYIRAVDIDLIGRRLKVLQTGADNIQQH